MKKLVSVLLSVGAVLLVAAPAKADTYTDSWRWHRHQRTVAAIRTMVWEESVYDLGYCEDVNGPPSDPEIYCSVLKISNLRSTPFKGRCVIRVQTGTYGIGGNPDQTVTDQAYPVTLNLGSHGQYFPTVIASYTQPVAQSGQYPDDWWSDYWVQSCTYKGVTQH